MKHDFLGKCQFSKKVVEKTLTQMRSYHHPVMVNENDEVAIIFLDDE